MKISYTYIIYGLFLALLSGCELIHDDPAELGFREDGEAYAYVSLTINTAPTAPGTRANPTGGEAGDDYEDGQDYEKAVNDLTLFFYESQTGDATDGVNRSDNPAIVAKAFIPVYSGPGTDDRIDEIYTVDPIRVNGLRMNHFYHVLAVANAGESFGEGITDLNGLKAATIDNVYTYSNNAYSNFVMSSEGDETPVLNITYENSKNNPATTTVDLERLVARVDYRIGPDADTDFKVDGNTVTATIERAMLVNMYKQDTYVLKRVASDIKGTPEYLGDETYNNYVIDPNTSQKTLPSSHESWYDHYFPNLSDEVGTNDKTEWEDWLIKGDEIKDPDTQEAWYRLGYPKENTSSVDAQGRYYSTGVVFEASYSKIPNVTNGSTFFRYKGTIYPALEDAMNATYNGDVPNAYFKESQAFESFEILTQYINSLPGNEDPAGYKDYLKTATETNFEGSYWTWNYYKQNVLCFSADEQGEYTVATAETRKALHERGYGTETFLNGRGYYIYWIRHNGGSGSDSFSETVPMAYGIVRNNVYKLTVNSISVIGDDTPGGNATLDILVAVQNWNKLEEDEVEWDE